MFKNFKTRTHRANNENSLEIRKIVLTSKERDWRKYHRLPEVRQLYDIMGGRFESLETAIIENRRELDALRSWGAKKEANPRAKILTQKIHSLTQILNRCSVDHPCGSAACRICARSYRIGMVHKYKDRLDEGKWWFVTLMFYDKAMTHKEFYRWGERDLAKLKNQLYYQMRKVKLEAHVLGGFDVGFSKEHDKWIPHFHLLTNAKKSDINKIRPFMNRESNMKAFDGKLKPMQILPFDGSLDALTYCHKGYWMERVTKVKEDGTTSRWKTRLRGVKFRLSIVKRHEFKFSGMHFEYGGRKHTGK